MHANTLRYIKSRPSCFYIREQYDVNSLKCQKCGDEIECGQNEAWANNQKRQKQDTRSLEELIKELEECQPSDVDEPIAQNKGTRTLALEDAPRINKANSSAIQSAEVSKKDAGSNEPAGTMAGPAISHGPVSVGSAPSPATTVKVDTEEAKDAKSGEYSFPMCMGRPYESDTNEQLVSRLTALLHAGFEAQPPQGYSAVREEICAIHIEANRRQQHAPRFRPMQRLEKEAVTQDQINAARDRQVIDIHWRALSRDKPSAFVNGYPTIYNDEPFDLAAAERFAKEKWTAQAKARHLHLTTQSQWENAVIQDESIRQKWRTIRVGNVRGALVKEAGAPQIETRLREAAFPRNNLQMQMSIRGMVDAWKARKMIGSNVAAITRMIALMSGSKSRDPRAVTRTLVSLDRLLGTPAKTVKMRRNSTKVTNTDTKGNS